METDFLASETNFFWSERFFQVETIIYISLSQFLQKDYILANATDILASGNHCLPFFQIVMKMKENGSS